MEDNTESKIASATWDAIFIDTVRLTWKDAPADMDINQFGTFYLGQWQAAVGAPVVHHTAVSAPTANATEASTRDAKYNDYFQNRRHWTL